MLSAINSYAAGLDAAAKREVCAHAGEVFAGIVSPIVAGFCAELPPLCPAAIELGEEIAAAAAADFKRRECS